MAMAPRRAERLSASPAPPEGKTATGGGGGGSPSAEGGGGGLADTTESVGFKNCRNSHHIGVIGGTSVHPVTDLLLLCSGSPDEVCPQLLLDSVKPGSELLMTMMISDNFWPRLTPI